MENLNAARRRPVNSGNFTSNKPKPENVLVQILSVNQADPNKIDPAKDTAQVALLHPAFGKEATFDNDGLPSTILTARINMGHPRRYKEFAPGVTTSKSPTEFAEVAPGRRKGSGDPMSSGGLLMLNGATLNSDGEIVTDYIVIAQRRIDSDREYAFENVVATVEPVKQKKTGDGKVFYVQNRKVYYAEDSTRLAAPTIEDLRAAVISKLSDTERFEKTFALIRIADSRVADPNGLQGTVYPYQALTETINLAQGEGGVSLSAEASFDAWLHGQKVFRGAPEYRRDANGEKVVDLNGEPIPELRSDFLTGILQSIATNPEAQKHMIIEVIGGHAFTTGATSMPGTHKTGDYDALDNSVAYMMPAENYENGAPITRGNTGEQVMVNGLSRSNFMVQRVAAEKSSNGIASRWFGTRSYVTRPKDRLIYQERELITPHTPPELVRAFDAQAERRAAARLEAYFNRQKASPQKPQQQDNSSSYQPSGTGMGR